MGLFGNIFGLKNNVAQNTGAQDSFVPSQPSSAGAVITVEGAMDFPKGVIVNIQVNEGVLRTGQSATINGQKVIVNSIEVFHIKSSQAEAGKKATIMVSGGSKDLFGFGQKLTFV
jgi:translation elongation factor EF-Tu-like GTPase